MKRFLVLLTIWGMSALSANAHEFRPAYLELRETATDTYEILWKVPARGGNERLGIYVRLPVDTRELAEPHGVFASGAYVERWRVHRGGGLAGQVISIDGLVASGSDVLVRLEHADGSTQTALLQPSRPSFVVESAPKATQVAVTYLRLGIEHIWGGVDHLLFVLALLLLVRGWRRVVVTITAFTVAHSITLAAATLGFVHVPRAPVEATIALSIVFVAAEIVHHRQGQPGLTERAPWLIAFIFGLLHGFGFASALNEIGLPQNFIPLALLFFNVGVEVGQLLFIGAVFALVFLAQQTASRIALPKWEWAWRVPPYAIGSVAAFWVIQRITLFVGQ